MRRSPTLTRSLVAVLPLILLLGCGSEPTEEEIYRAAVREGSVAAMESAKRRCKGKYGFIARQAVAVVRWRTELDAAVEARDLDRLQRCETEMAACHKELSELAALYGGAPRAAAAGFRDEAKELRDTAGSTAVALTEEEAVAYDAVVGATSMDAATAYLALFPTGWRSDEARRSVEEWATWKALAATPSEAAERFLRKHGGDSILGRRALREWVRTVTGGLDLEFPVLNQELALEHIRTHSEQSEMPADISGPYAVSFPDEEPVRRNEWASLLGPERPAGLDFTQQQAVAALGSRVAKVPPDARVLLVRLHKDVVLGTVDYMPLKDPARGPAIPGLDMPTTATVEMVAVAWIAVDLETREILGRYLLTTYPPKPEDFVNRGTAGQTISRRTREYELAFLKTL